MKTTLIAVAGLLTIATPSIASPYAEMFRVLNGLPSGTIEQNIRNNQRNQQHQLNQHSAPTGYSWGHCNHAGHCFDSHGNFIGNR